MHVCKNVCDTNVCKSSVFDVTHLCISVEVFVQDIYFHSTGSLVFTLNFFHSSSFLILVTFYYDVPTSTKACESLVWH